MIDSEIGGQKKGLNNATDRRKVIQLTETQKLKYYLAPLKKQKETFTICFIFSSHNSVLLCLT